MRKMWCVLLSAVLLLGAISAVYAEDSQIPEKAVQFSDLKTTNWAYEAVSAMNSQGIVKGYPDGSFKPVKTVTYGEFIKMALIAKTGEDVGNSEKGNWARSYYNKAVELGYFSQNAITESQLNLPIPRCDMALIISHILGEQKIENYGELQDSLEDMDLTVKNEYDIMKSYASGIITGYEDNTFRPEKTLTRAESATVIYRLIDESKRILPGEKKEEADGISGTDIASVIKNYKIYGEGAYSGTDSEGHYKEWTEPGPFADATSYEFVTDMSGYKVESIEKNGVKGIKINDDFVLNLGWGNMYLMKDNNIVKFTSNGIYDDIRQDQHLDISTIEYFVFPNYKADQVTYVEGVGQISHKIGIMPNPLYKGQ